MKTSSEYLIVLTADRTLMSEYSGSVFLGFSACIPVGLISNRLYFSLLCPSIDVNKDGSVNVAPCGTRKIEASLLNYGFHKEDIIVAHPEHLEKAVGPKTRVIGVTENDPLGIGPATSTFTAIFGGEAFMAIKFREILNHPAIKRFKPKVVVGGPGAWQLEPEEVRRCLGIDCVVIGEGERVVGSLFGKALNGEELPKVVYGEPASVDEIPIIEGATIHGLVEIARGCGRNCDFCVPTLQRYRCLPLSHILQEVDVNLKAGRQPLLHAEDVLRYGAKGVEVNKKAVIDLFRSVKNHPNVEDVRMSHFALASVAHAPDVIEEISNILGANKKNWLSGQTGIETGSPQLIRRHMRGKCWPFAPEKWPDTVLKGFEILSENNWVPCATLILGLPGEGEKDLEATISLIENLRPFKSLIVPLFLVAMHGAGEKYDSFTLDQMTPEYSELLLKCWKHNLEWVPILFKDWTEMSMKNRLTRLGLGALISHGIRRTGSLIRTCEKEYDYDLRAMIEDYKMRKRAIRGSLPIRLLKPLLRIGS